MDLETSARKLRGFAEQVCRGASPLYEHLAQKAAGDPQLVDIVGTVPAGQPTANLFFAAVHFLLLSGIDHPLARYYPSCCHDPLPLQQAFGPFRDFCLAYEGAIRELIASRRVQTNEVGRCAYLLPAFLHAARLADSRPLALLEVGTSAGLNLHWDKYAYDYGTGSIFGRPSANVRITAELRGPHLPPLTAELPKIIQRIGVDLHLVDVARTEEALWLRALVWPDQPARMKLLTAAIEAARRDPPELIEGDAVEVTPRLIAAVPDDCEVCILHCHTLNQFTGEQQTAFHRLLANASQQRRIFELSAEWMQTPTTELHLLDWQSGQCRREHLANIDQHGRWIEWRGSMVSRDALARGA